MGTEIDCQAIRMRSVHKAFGNSVVLDGFDLVVPRGARIALIGPSGAGKTTVLRILMALETIDDGAVEVAGQKIWSKLNNGRLISPTKRQISELHRHIGIVFQEFNLFPHMSVLRNVSEAPVRVTGLTRREAEALAICILESVGLEDKVNLYPAQLSGGQKQRVAIARALAMNPDIILFDEVTSALDPELVEEVLSVLRQLVRKSSKTMVFVTHEVAFAREIADRVVFMDKGRVVEDDSPAVVLSRPNHPRTREFLRSVLRC